MSNKITDQRFKAEALRCIKETSREFFKEFFPKHKDIQAAFSEVGKLTGDFMAKQLKSFVVLHDGDIRLMVNKHPVVNVVAAEWKSCGLFRKTIKGVFFVWHDGITSQDTALTLAEFYAFLNAHGLDGMATVNWIGAAVSNLNLAELKCRLDNEEPLFFTNTDDWQSCDINYNLKAISYDNANKTLVLKVEDRLFT